MVGRKRSAPVRGGMTKGDMVLSSHLFNETHIQREIEDSYYEPIRCTNLNVTDYRSPLEFTILPLDDYLTSPNFLLHLQVKVLDPDGAALDPTKPISTVNSFLTSLFSTAEVTLGSTPMPFSVGSYPYVSYMKNLLNYSTSAQSSFLTKSLFYRDTKAAFDDLSVTNVGFSSRSQWIMGGAIDLLGPLNLDLETCDSLLPNRIAINLKLHRSQAPWVLLVPGATNEKVYQIHIQLAELMVQRFKVRCQDIRGLENILTRRPATYDFISTSMQTFTFGTEATKLDAVLLTGQLPKRITLVLCPQDHFNGSYTKNPFNFGTHGVRSISYEFNGKVIPKQPMDWSWSAPYAMSQPYIDLLQLFSPKGLPDSDIRITPQDFSNGYGIFSQALIPAFDPSFSFTSPAQFGSLTLHIEFARKQTATLMILIFLEHQKRITINRNLDVQIE